MYVVMGPNLNCRTLSQETVDIDLLMCSVDDPKYCSSHGCTGKELTLILK